jgi:hypothetical protein
MAVREFRRFDLGEPMSLHWEALPARQREVLRACVGPTHRWRAYLAGGTALALHLGHRQSEDLDWFTPETLDTDDLLASVTGMGFPVEIDQNQTGTFLAVVGGVKFSVFRYRYDVLDPFVDAKGVNLASIRDLAAMKLTALIGRATKRDYVDIHELLVGRHTTLPAMVQAFESKYPIAHASDALRAITFFDDVVGEMPRMLTATTWEKVKADLCREVRKLTPRDR